MKYQIPKGLFDILPIDCHPKERWQTSEVWRRCEETLRHIALSYGFSEVRTPIFERTELFSRSVGDTSDIVFKEMYTFEDKAQRLMTLRPEGTAPIMRTLIENQILHEYPIQKLFYLGPFFRYDRPQAGRYRQFHQFGVEAIGVADPEQDAEIIQMVNVLLHQLGICDFTLLINSIGSPEARAKYCSALFSYLNPFQAQLSEDSQARLKANPLRILDSKDPKDIEIVQNAPQLSEFLDTDSKEHFSQLLNILDQLNIPYSITPNLVRGLDYYNKTVFEFVSKTLGAQNTLVAGGRYDGLTAKLGGQNTPAFGFGLGIERLIITLLNQNPEWTPPEKPPLVLIPLGDQERIKALKIASKLRHHHITTDVYLKGKKLQKAMQYADKKRAHYVIILGEQELTAQTVSIKNMLTRSQEIIAIRDLPSFFLSLK